MAVMSAILCRPLTWHTQTRFFLYGQLPDLPMLFEFLDNLPVITSPAYKAGVAQCSHINITQILIKNVNPSSLSPHVLEQNLGHWEWAQQCEFQQAFQMILGNAAISYPPNGTGRSTYWTAVTTEEDPLLTTEVSKPPEQPVMSLHPIIAASPNIQEKTTMGEFLQLPQGL